MFLVVKHVVDAHKDVAYNLDKVAIIKLSEDGLGVDLIWDDGTVTKKAVKACNPEVGHQAFSKIIMALGRGDKLCIL